MHPSLHAGSGVRGSPFESEKEKERKPELCLCLFEDLSE